LRRGQAVFTVGVLANEKQTKEYQDLMRRKRGGSLISKWRQLRRQGEDPRFVKYGASLVEHIKAKDYDGIATDEVCDEKILKKVQILWVEKESRGLRSELCDKSALRAADDPKRGLR